MKIKDIFTPGRFPTWTYVDDHLKDKGQQLHDALDDSSMLISISGPSKSGKTVFVEHVLGKEHLIQITGAGVTAPEDLWIRVFDMIGTPVSKSSTEGTALAQTIGGKGAVEGNVFVAKGSAEVSCSQTSSNQTAATHTFATDLLQLLIKEISGTGMIVFIDDFHYIPKDIQSELAKQIKEAIRQGVKFICASVPYHSDDVIRSNPDLRGRIFSIDFDYWGAEILKKIAAKGFNKANVNCSNEMINKLAAESSGSPQLMQVLCLNSCYEMDLREITDESKTLSYDATLFGRICARTVQSTDYSSVVEKMVEGPKTRGSDRKIHISTYGWQGDVYKFLLKAISLDPPQLNFRYQPLVDRINSICNGDAPSGSSITSACYHSTTIANDIAGDNIVEWDAENDVFDIRDPYLLFYLRWSEIIG